MLVRLKTRWIGKNVNLDLVVKVIKVFFEDRDFQTLSKESSEETLIFAKKRDDSGLSLVVKIQGKPDDFTVEFRGGGSRSMRFFSSLLGLIGAGGLALKRMKVREVYERIESDFWSFMDQMVSDLVESV